MEDMDYMDAQTICLLLQVGQVIQVYPHQVALMGIIPAMVVAMTTQFLNYYTLWLLVILFLERKRAMVSTKLPSTVIHWLYLM